MLHSAKWSRHLGIFNLNYFFIYFLIFYKNLNLFEFNNVFETHNCNPLSIFQIRSCQNEQTLVIYDEKVKIFLMYYI